MAVDTYCGHRRRVDRDICEAILNRMEETNIKLFDRPHSGRKHTAPRPNQRGAIGLRGSEFWGPIEDIFDRLEKQIYPYENPIEHIYINIFNTTNPDKPSYMSLHVDGHSAINNPESLYTEDYITYISSILIDKSEDFEGGEIVIAGDHFRDVPEDIRPEDPKNLGFRLKVERQNEIGDTVQWNCFTYHGIAEVKSGKRIAMVVHKRAKR